jgi:hypothetical protein
VEHVLRDSAARRHVSEGVGFERDRCARQPWASHGVRGEQRLAAPLRRHDVDGHGPDAQSFVPSAIWGRAANDVTVAAGAASVSTWNGAMWSSVTSIPGFTPGSQTVGGAWLDSPTTAMSTPAHSGLHHPLQWQHVHARIAPAPRLESDRRRCLGFVVDRPLGDGRQAILHSDGMTWSLVDAGFAADFTGVTGVTATDVWASASVGGLSSNTGNGWTQSVPVGVPLNAITNIQGSLWAVVTQHGASPRRLDVDGRAGRRGMSPSSPPDVTWTSTTDAWAVGQRASSRPADGSRRRHSSLQRRCPGLPSVRSSVHERLTQRACLPLRRTMSGLSAPGERRSTSTARRGRARARAPRWN